MTKQIIERSVKQVNNSGNGVMVLITREAKAIKLKANDKVQVTAINENGKEYIIVEKFPPKE